MSFPGFQQLDFDVFTVAGLEPRMEALISNVRPKLTQLGDILAPHLSVLCQEPCYPHVAKHARRTVHPPEDTWVAWANNKRGYKAYPHFQVGLFASHLFIQFAIIYESSHKGRFANQLDSQIDAVRKQIPDHFFWSTDHTKPQVAYHRDMELQHFEQLIYKLQHVKKAEVLCGLLIDRQDPLVAEGDKLIETIQTTFEQLMPLYQMSF